MPSGMAQCASEAIASVNRAELELERSVWGRTGFVNVIEVKGQFQTRLQVPGDGRGGIQKRKQHSLPGLLRHCRGCSGLPDSHQEADEGAKRWQARCAAEAGQAAQAAQLAARGAAARGSHAGVSEHASSEATGRCLCRPNADSNAARAVCRILASAVAIQP